MSQKRALVLGGGGFIGHHMVTRLKAEGYFVRAVDLKYPDFSVSKADDFILGDLKDPSFVRRCISQTEDTSVFDEIYQFAADMGGAGFVFTGENDAVILHNSVLINLNLLNEVVFQFKSTQFVSPNIFYSSSACMYPQHNQVDPSRPILSEESAYPANPDSEYGWEKLFSERLYLAYARNFGLKIKIARYHNIYGPEGTWFGGREKAPAALCRKIASVLPGQPIKVWGNGNQTRSFLYIDDCIEATRRLMLSPNFSGPVNIGSEEMISINKLVEIIASIAQKEIQIQNISGPTGVAGRTSDNTLIKQMLNWDYIFSLEKGLELTYSWIKNQVSASNYKEPT